MTRRTSILILAGAAAAALLIFAVVATVIYRTVILSEPDQFQVQVTSHPEHVTLAVNGQQIEHSGSEIYTVDTDRLDLGAAADGWEDYDDIILLDAEETTVVDLVMDPLTEEAEQQAAEERSAHDAEAGAEYLQEVEDHIEANPILEQLPQVENTFEAYEGLTQDGENDLAIYLYLYPGDEDTGREDFTEWMHQAGFDPDDFEIVEEINTSGAPLEADQPPAADELDTLEPEDPQQMEPSAEGLEADELVREFLYTTNIHDGAEDPSLTTAQLRATGLMTPDLAESITEPANPTNPPTWWEAMDSDAVSYPWITEATVDTTGEDETVYTATVCRIWIPEDGSAPFPDNPRHWSITVTGTGDNHQVSGFDFQDPYIGDDPDQNECSHHD